MVAVRCNRLVYGTIERIVGRTASGIALLDCSGGPAARPTERRFVDPRANCRFTSKQVALEVVILSDHETSLIETVARPCHADFLSPDGVGLRRTRVRLR